MKIQHFLRAAAVLSLSVVVLAGCSDNPYKQDAYNFAGRPTPPSQLHSRVMVSVGNTGFAGTGGSLSILDSLRDIRNNVYNVNALFTISGYSANNGTNIFNYPEQLTGYIYSYNTSGTGDVTAIDYGGEKTKGSIATVAPRSSDIAVSYDGQYVLAAQETTGTLTVMDRTSLGSTVGAGTSYPLSLPGVYKVAMNPSHTVMLAMVRNSNQIYRVIKLNSTQAPPAGYISCLPQNLPVYCVVPVPGTYDRPTTAYTSPDGATIYVLNCGKECGGSSASVSVLSAAALQYLNYDVTTSPALAANITVPGATAALSDGTTLYVSGQQYVPADGLFTGVLSTIDVNTNTVTGQYSISDGTHTKMIFGDDNTLWIGSSNCASGERYKNKQNYNCLTRFDISAKSAAVVPAVDPNSATSSVPYPNEDLNQYYYGSLTGICWVQGYHKMYTAYGGQVHIFNTADGTEIYNGNVTVQGVALDVAYLDATTNAAN